MNVKRAACEPCRRAKLACGHERPTCIRCRSRGQEDACSYRERPFRRRKGVHHPQRDSLRESGDAVRPTRETPASHLASPLEDVPKTPAQPHRYPNPGFLGTSSHSAIFNQVSSCAVSDSVPSNLHDSHLAISPSPAPMLQDKALVDRALQALNYLNQSDIPRLNSLVQAWIDAGVNLPLAEPFVLRCSEAVLHLRQSSLVAAEDHHAHDKTSHRATSLLENTHKPIKLCRSSSVAEYFQQILGHNLRWEAIGIFFTAASRAALDTSSFTPLYTNEEQRRVLIKTLTYISDCCLETCLALDYLNDLQLVLQYENFIVHSQVDGDQSYHSWRRMGDLVSTLSALGYHERIDEDTSDIPMFVAELRRAAFARIYVADKSLAIFLGRPPRLVKPYCCFQLPGNIPGLWDDSSMLRRQSANRLLQYENTEANQPQKINYMADTRYSALFASLKEDIINVSRSRHTRNVAEDIIELRSKIKRQWEDLPEHFRLDTSLKDCHHGPFERDFLVGARLDYLHTHFLLNLISQRKISEPDELLLTVAGEILSLTVEAIILRDRLVNSGTCLIWKVAQYGLPAAGVISLALLNSSIRPDTTSVSRSKMFQGLSALVTEITIGAWIQAGEPNFALFTQATRTIQSLLDSMIAWKPHAGPVDSSQIMSSNAVEDWDPYLNFQPCEFEMDFWANLAEHPTLIN